MNVIKNAYIFSGIVAVFGIATFLIPKPVLETKTEEQIEEMVPNTVRGLKWIKKTDEDPQQSYKMSQQSYDALKPFGIVCRVFKEGGDEFEAVVIASNSKDSFHDPRVCFSAQSWTIEKFTPATIKTKTRGDIPATVIQVTSDRVRRQLAAFIYKGPGNRFYGKTNELKIAFLFEQIKGSTDLNGVFFRFMPTFENKNLTEAEQTERLEKFISEFMDESNKSSKGFL